MSTLTLFWKNSFRDMKADLVRTIEMIDGSPDFEIEIKKEQNYTIVFIKTFDLDSSDLVEQIELQGQLTNVGIRTRPSINDMHELSRWFCSAPVRTVTSGRAGRLRASQRGPRILTRQPASFVGGSVPLPRQSPHRPEPSQAAHGTRFVLSHLR